MFKEKKIVEKILDAESGRYVMSVASRRSGKILSISIGFYLRM